MFQDGFWLRPLVPDYGSITQPPLTDAMLAQAENKLGVNLPQAYVELLKRLNGGMPQRNTCEFTVGGKTMTCDPIQAVMGISDLSSNDRREADNILFMHGFRETFELPKEIVPICLHAPPWMAICLDYRVCDASGEPRIVFVNGHGTTDGHERIETDEVNASVCCLATSFKEFLGRLFYSSHVTTFGFPGSGPGDDLLRELNAFLQMQMEFGKVRSSVLPYSYRIDVWFHDQTDAYGGRHPVWIGNLGTESDPILANFVLCPNQGLDGFLDFPAHADCQWMLHCDIAPFAYPKLLSALERLSVPSKLIYRAS